MKKLISKIFTKFPTKPNTNNILQSNKFNYEACQNTKYEGNYIVETEQYKITYTKSYFNDCDKLNWAL